MGSDVADESLEEPFVNSIPNDAIVRLRRQ